jgi:hypothetical protein
MNKPPVDLNKPIENPGLSAAFNDYNQNKCNETIIKVIKNIVASNFLVAIISDQIEKTEPDKKGMATIKKGSIIKFFNCYNQNNECFFPIFTDWVEIKKWTDQQVDTLVMPCIQVLDFIKENKEYLGIVINPGSIGWTLNKDNIRAIIEDFYTTP